MAFGTFSRKEKDMKSTTGLAPLAFRIGTGDDVIKKI
jgi:hypothetical protein